MAEQILFGIDVSGIDKSLGKELTKALMSDQGKLKSVFSAALADATKKGTEHGLEASKVEEYLGRAFQQGEATLSKAAALYAKAAQTTDDKARKALRDRADAMRKSVEEETASRMKAQTAIIDRHGKAIKQWEDFQSKSAHERIETMTKGLQDAWSALKGGDAQGMADMISSALGMASGRAASGAAMSAGASGAAAGGGAAAGAAGGLAAAASAVAAVAIPLAIVAGAIAVVVKLLVDAIGQTKEFNKKLLEGAGAGDFMMGTMNTGVNDFISGIGTARRAANDFVFNVKWGTVAEDLIGIQKAANEAGLTFREMAGDTSTLANGLAGLPGHMELALRYSKLLGVSAEEVGTQMGKWTTELGGNLRSLEERFATITQLAMSSGFGVKRFYTMIQQATTGMSLYNVRVEEAAALLKKTGEILGEEEASDFIATLQKGFASEDYPTRLKRVMLTGMADTQRIVSRSAEATGARLAEDYAKPLQEALINVADEVGLSAGQIDVAMSGGDGMVDMLGGMSAKQQRTLLASLRSQGNEQGRAAARQLQQVMDLSTAAQKGDMDSLVGALDNLDMGGKLAMLLDTQLMGNKKLSEMTEMERHVFSQTQGLDTEMVEKLARMEEALLADYEAAEDYHGSFSDYVQEFGYREEELTGSLSEQEYLARATVEATRDLGNIMENGVQYVLEQIFGILEGFYQSWTGMSQEEIAARDSAIAVQEENYQTLLALQQAAEEEVAEAREKKATARTVGEREDADKDLKEALSKLADRESDAKLVRTAIGEMRGQGGAGTFSDYTEEDYLRMGMQQSIRRHGTDSLSEEAGTMHEAGRRVGKYKKRASMYGLHGDITDASTGMYYSGQAMASHPDPVNQVTGSALMGIGGLYSYAGHSGIERVSEEEGASAVVEVLDTLSQDERDRQTELAEEQARRDDESLGATEDLVAETERMRRGAADAVAEGIAINDARGALRAAGMDASAVNISKFIGDSREAEAFRSLVAARTSSVDDFIYRGSGGAGTITPINSADQFFGAKPGGAIDQAVGGGGKTVNININGGDTQQIYQVVKRAMQAGR